MLQSRILIAKKPKISFSTAIPPILPPSTLSGIIRINPIKSGKKRNKRNGNSNSGSIGGGGNNLLNQLKSNWKSGPPATDEFVNLFAIYGNILAKEPELLHRYRPLSDSEFIINYPIDPSLLKLFESSVKFWYENGRKPAISLLSIKAPSRATTWDLAKHLAIKSGKSHLAIVPFTMFYELMQTCQSNLNNSVSVQEAQVLGNLILSKLTGESKKSVGTGVTDIPGGSPLSSRCLIQVCEYLFACMEASLGGSASVTDEKFTLLLDGVEEFVKSRKGGEAVMKDLSSWANLFESTRRRVILGLRTADSVESTQIEDEEVVEDESEDTSSLVKDKKSNSGNNSKKSSNNTNSAFQMMTNLLLNVAGGSSQSGASDMIQPVTNVYVSGSMMRLYLTPPKNDKRQQLKYNQIIALERKKDRFDSNMTQLKMISQQRWNVKLDLKLKSKYDFPSNHSEIWGKLSSSGRGLLTRENLIRDEFNEIVMSILGEKKPLNVDSLNEAIDGISRIRHDPSQLSSDELSNFLSERQVSMSSLTKYEKRFINCISTATTQTHFKDVTLPAETLKTLKSLTSLPLTHPELFTQGILKNSLTGVLLFGPPGTGKTMLARAVAQESGATFLAVNMSNIFDMYVGEGEKNVKVRVRDLE